MLSSFSSVFPQQWSLFSELFRKSFISRQNVGIFLSSGSEECSNGAIHEMSPFLSVFLENLVSLPAFPSKMLPIVTDAGHSARPEGKAFRFGDKLYAN